MFLGTTHQKDKIYQMTTKYTKWPSNIVETLSFPWSSKNAKIGYKIYHLAILDCEVRKFVYGYANGRVRHAFVCGNDDA
jgi:hypothetical protein